MNGGMQAAASFSAVWATAWRHGSGTGRRSSCADGSAAPAATGSVGGDRRRQRRRSCLQGPAQWGIAPARTRHRSRRSPRPPEPQPAAGPHPPGHTSLQRLRRPATARRGAQRRPPPNQVLGDGFQPRSGSENCVWGAGSVPGRAERLRRTMTMVCTCRDCPIALQAAPADGRAAPAWRRLEVRPSSSSQLFAGCG